MKLRILCTSVVFALTVLAGPACAGPTMTLEQCLKTGIENNPNYLAARFKAESAGKDVKMARADFLPSVSSSYAASSIFKNVATGPSKQDYLNQNIHAFNVKLTQILYAGSRIVNGYERAKFIEQATLAETELARLELSYNIESTFYKVMKSRQDTVAATEAVGRLTESVKSAEAFLKNELIPNVDVLKARVDLADAQNQLGLAKNNENRFREVLFALMDITPDPDMEFVDGDYVVLKKRPVFETSFTYAIEHRPDLKSLQYQYEAATKQQDISAAKYLPVARFDIGYYDQDNHYAEKQVSIFGTTTDPDQNNKYLMAGVTFSWDLFDGGRAYYEQQKYSVEARKFSALKQDAQNTISTGIRKAIYSMTEAEERLNSSVDALAAAKENYTSEEKRLKAGISTVQQLLEAQGRLVRAEANKANAILDYQLAKSELKAITGGEKFDNEL